MRPFTPRPWSIAAALVCVLAPVARGEGPAKTDLARAGKAATALVEASLRRAQGSAFCIHADGIFVTNEHVVAQDPTVTLILNPGTKGVKVLSAKVLRTDKELDLALLQIQGSHDLPALPLGTDDKLTELTEVVAFGFPFGTALLPGQNEYPAISVNAGRVTSLRLKNGELDRIQLDNTLNPGNSGGPVLDQDGKVVGVVVRGVVVGGVAGTGVNFAIPVSHVTRFLGRPEILFEPPALKLAGVHDPAEFRARVLTFLPGAARPDLELVVHDDRSRRRFPMERHADEYRARVVVAPPATAPAALRLTARFGDGSVRGTADDVAFRVGDRDVKLSEVRYLATRSGPRVLLHEGRWLKGTIAGLDRVAVRLGGTSVALDLTAATEVRLQPPGGLSGLGCTVIARQDGKEVGRLTRPLPVEGVAEPGDDLAAVYLEPPELEGDPVTRPLAAPVRDLAVGGGGRYLVLHLPKAHQLAVFDVNEAKVVRALPAPDDGLKFAAGMEHLFVALPGSRTLQRWSLLTFNLEASASYPAGFEILALGMGSASHGPLVCHFREQVQPGAFGGMSTLCFLNPDTLERLDVGWSRNAPSFMNEVMHLRCSADGKYLGMWTGSVSPSGVHWIRWQGNVGRDLYNHSSNGHVIPGPGGKVLFTGAGMLTPAPGKEFSPIDALRPYPGTNPRERYVPAAQGDYYLSLGPTPPPGRPFPVPGAANPPADEERPVTVQVYKVGVDRPLLKLPGVPVPAAGEDWVKHDFTVDKRFQLIPQAKLLITVPTSNDRLVLRRANLEPAQPDRK